MDLRSSILKMERWSRNRRVHRFLHPFFIFVFLTIFSFSSANSIVHSDRPLEGEIEKALSKTIQSGRVEVKVWYTDEKTAKLKRLAAKMDGVVLGQMKVDHMTLVYEDPVIDLIQLNREKELNILSYSKNKMGILISARAIEGYLNNKANQFKKRYNRISVKFSPPYIECLFDVPASEISPETLRLLDKFVKGAKLEGYAAFQIKAKSNALYAFSSKVIVNHFLMPNLILQELQTKFNPFDGIPVLKPFQYSINTVTVQNKYLFLTN